MNFYYLCADLHQYQSGECVISKGEGTPKMRIKQYIVGTGGAKKDDYMRELIPTTPTPYIGTNYTLSYFMNTTDIATSESSNGFLKCCSSSDNREKLDFQFVRVNRPDNGEIKGGRKRSTLRRRRRTNKRHRRRQSTRRYRRHPRR